MKKFLICSLFIFFSILITLSVRDPDFRAGMGLARTSDSLADEAISKCKEVPELDGRRFVCQVLYIREKCNLGLDLKICGQDYLPH
jgi:hypothetical protein